MSVNIASAAEKPINFVFAHLHYSKNWDVHQGNSLWTIFIGNNIVEPLIRLNDKTEYEGAIATAWSFTKDRKTLSLILSDKFHFHDGSKITFSDVEATVRKTGERQRAAHTDFWEDLCDGSDGVKGVELKGNVLSLNFRKPANGILYSLATPEIGIVPSTYFSESDRLGKAIRNLSGPYQVENFEKTRLELKAVPNHKLITRSSPERAVIQEITNFDEAVAYLQKNMEAVVIASDYSSGLKLSKLPFKTFSSAPALTEFFLPNMNDPKMKSYEFRKKVFSYLSFARKDLKIDPRLGMITSQLLAPDNIARLPENSLSDLYDKEPKPLSSPLKLKVRIFDWMKDTPIPRELGKNAEKLNVRLEFETAEVSKVKQYLESDKHELVYLYSGVSAKDPIIEMQYLFKHPLTSFAKHSTNDLAGKLALAKSETDDIKYKDKLKELHLALLQEHLMLPIIHTRMIYATGGMYSLRSMDHFDGGLDIWKWEKAEK